MLLLTCFLAFLISSILAFIAHLLGKKSSELREKSTPFESGFDPVKKARIPFSLRFLLVTIIFLIFDVELALLLPLGISLNAPYPLTIIITTLIIVIILILGLIHEWNLGSLNWVL